MKKSYSFILVLILIAGLLCSCHINKVSGDGNVVSKEIPIKDYDEIQIEGENVDFKYMQSDDVPYLKVETDQNIMDLLDINTDSKVLVVRPKNRHTGINPTRFIVITNSTALKEFKMAGGGNCDLGKGLNGKKLEIRFAGGGTIKADSIAITRLDCEIAGSGTVSLSGKTEKMNIKSAGSSITINQNHCLHCGRCAEICPYRNHRKQGNIHQNSRERDYPIQRKSEHKGKKSISEQFHNKVD